MPKPTAPADPLADLRQQPADAAGVTLTQPTPPDETPEPERLELLPLDQLWHDAAINHTVAAWHNDETATGMIHRPAAGCSCRYLARMAVQAIHGAPVEPTDDDEQQES